MRFFALHLILVLGLMPALVSAQVLPPDFLCVTNDTLVWSPASNTCGPFTSYTVFGSQDPNGPYSELTTITDEAQTRFFHADANNQTWYYYLVSEHACADPVSPPSDTLDNLIPLAGPIEFVSVVDGAVQIAWEESPTPETSAYVISRNTSSGTTVIDTVMGGTTYTDTTAAPEEESQTYFVTAIDPCGNESLVIAPHATIFVESTEPSPCDPIIDLTFNGYAAWTEGVDRYEVFVSRDGGAYELVEAIAGNSSSYTYADGNDGEDLCFYVEAVANGTGFRSRSNVTCQAVSIIQPIRDIYALGATVLANGNVIFSWVWDPTATVVDAAFMAEPEGGTDVLIELPLAMPLEAENEFTDPGGNAQTGPYIYTVFGTDECDNTIESNPSPTLFLTGQAPGDGTNTLAWAPYVHAFGQVQAYELVRLGDMGEQTVFTGTANDLSYKDPIEPTDMDAAGTCYLLRATVLYTLPNGLEITQVLQSNTVCLEQMLQVYVPNVFAPEGVNTAFRPQLPFGTPQNYLMQIYDRWGGLVFESRNLSDGWNGRKNGEAMPQGVYLYRIELTQSNGETIKLTGDVMLMR